MTLASSPSDPADGPHPPPDTSRRRFLVRTVGGIVAASAFVLPGCSSGCSSRPPARPKAELPPTPPAPQRPLIPTEEPVVRVRIASVRSSLANEPPRADIGTTGGWIRVRPAGSTRHGVVLRAPLRVVRHRDRWTISDDGGIRPTLDGLEAVELLAPEREPTTFRIGESTYEGTLHLIAIPGSAADDGDGEIGFDIVNHLPMERYLPGVVIRELYSHWHLEAFAAQAVAARSFAAMEIEHNQTRRHFDVTNTQASQVFGGVTGSSRAHEAVQQTRGMVLAYRGFLVPGYYSSCCGGIGASAVDAISSHPANDVPPLDARLGPDICNQAPVYRWQHTRPIDDLTSRINAYGRARQIGPLANFASLRTIAVAAANRYGRPTRFRLIDARDRSHEISANDLRPIVNFAGSGVSRPQESLRSSLVRAEVQGNRMVFDGRGFGHGVGMCQHGAQAFALAGDSHYAILQAYYPGVELTQAYF